jgi:hypothetical protein
MDDIVLVAKLQNYGLNLVLFASSVPISAHFRMTRMIINFKYMHITDKGFTLLISPYMPLLTLMPEAIKIICL